MGKLLSQFDPKVQLGISSGSYILAFASGVLGVRMMATGPWWAALVLCLIGAVLVTVGGSAWPKKIPEGLQVVKERWEKSRSRATKSAAGKTIWKVGRSVVAAMAASLFIPVQMDGGFMRLAVLGGFGISAGFFGIRAAAWAGLAVFFAGHRLALSGLGVDFASPASRELLWISWNKGSQISWWWPIGLGLSPLIWIGTAALMVSMGIKMAEAMAERAEARAALEKIEARRTRMREKREREVVDPVAAAREATIKALAKARAVGTGDPGSVRSGDANTLDGVPKIEELSPVDKIERELSLTKLKRHADQARSLLQSMANEIDTASAGRRAFDRVVAAFTDAEKAILRNEPWGKDLLAYYDLICNVEDTAMRGGDGAVVAETSGVPSEDYMVHHSGPLLPVVDKASDEEIGGDLLDEEISQAPSEENQIFTRRGDKTKDLEVMISQVATGAIATVEPKLTPPNLEISSAERMDLPDAMVDEGDRAPVSDGPSASNDDAPAVAVVPLASNDAGEGGDVADKVIDGADLTANAPDAPAHSDDGDAEDGETELEDEGDGDDRDAVDQDADGGGMGEEDGPGLTEDHGQSDQAGDETAAAAVSAVEEAPVQVSAPAPAMPPEAAAATEKQLRDAGGAILSFSLNRELVLLSMGHFNSVDDVAGLLGIDPKYAERGYEKYAVMVALANHELGLKTLIEAGDEEAVRTSLAALAATSDVWPCEEVVSNAVGWLAAREAEAARLAEQNRLAEEERARVEKERLEAIDRDRLAEEARRAEEDRAARDAERLAREAAEEADRLKKAEEEASARLAELEKRRSRIANRIFVGALTDEILDDGFDLFGSVEDLARELDVDVDNYVQGRFDAFANKAASKKLYERLVVIFGDDSYVDEAKQMLDDNAEKLGFYEHPKLSLGDIRAWIGTAEAKRKMLGVVEEAPEKDGALDKITQRRIFIQKRNKMSPEMVEMLDQSLPGLIQAANSIANALKHCGDDAYMKGVHANNVAKAASAAAQVVAREKECREYAQAFFPPELFEGSDAWSALVDLAGKAPSEAAAAAPAVAAPAAPAPIAPPAAAPERVIKSEGKSAAAAKSQENMGKGFSLKRSLAQVQELDPAAEVAVIERARVPERDTLENSYRMTLVGVFGDHVDVESSENLPFYHVSLRDALGEPLGRIRIVSQCKSLPVWYDAKNELIHYIKEDGSAEALPGAKIRKQFDDAMKLTGEPGDRILGMIIVSPYLTEDGKTSFEPWLAGFKNAPVRILNNQMLNGDFVSAFVEEVTKA